MQQNYFVEPCSPPSSSVWPSPSSRLSTPRSIKSRRAPDPSLFGQRPVPPTQPNTGTTWISDWPWSGHDHDLQLHYDLDHDPDYNRFTPHSVLIKLTIKVHQNPLRWVKATSIKVTVTWIFLLSQLVCLWWVCSRTIRGLNSFVCEMFTNHKVHA